MLIKWVWFGDTDQELYESGNRENNKIVNYYVKQATI